MEKNDLFLFFPGDIVEHAENMVAVFYRVVPVKAEFRHMAHPDVSGKFRPQEAGRSGEYLDDDTFFFLACNSADVYLGMAEVGSCIHLGNGDERMDTGVLDMTLDKLA